MSRTPGEVRVGCSGWVYRDWRGILYPEELPQRDWFRHMIYAPGLQTGYGTKTLPGVREAIEDRRWADAERYAGIIAGVLNTYSDRIEKITALLKDSDAPAR